VPIDAERVRSHAAMVDALANLTDLASPATW
jgi:hypothetical protein